MEPPVDAPHLVAKSLRLLFAGLWFVSPLSAQWTLPAAVDTSTDGLVHQNPVIARISSEGVIGVVWDERTSDGRNPIVFERSDDFGLTFQRSIVIDSVVSEPTWFAPGTGRALHDFTFGPAGSIWVLWSDLILPDQGSVEYSFRISRSIDDGASFTQVFVGPRNFGPHGTPRLVITPNGSIMIVCDEGGLKCSRFPGGDFTVREDTPIPTAPYAATSWSTALDQSSGTLYVAWEGYRFVGPESFWIQFCSSSPDTGHSFGPPVRVDTTSTIQVGGQALAAKGDSLLLVYSSNIGQTGDGMILTSILAAISRDRGSTFSTLRTLADSSAGYSGSAAAASASAGIAAVWEQGVHVARFISYSQLEFLHASSFAQGFGEVKSVYAASYPAVILTDRRRLIVFMTQFQGGRGRNYSTRTDLIDGVDFGRRNVGPEALLLSQNYPNPFNPSTMIKYELPKSSVVKLSVYDMLGREVSVLVSERKNAGSYEVKFDATGLSSGVYFYRMTAGDYMATKKLLLIR